MTIAALARLFHIGVRSVLAAGILAAAGFFLYAGIILIIDRNRDDLAPADAIIVLTGSAGRIEAGFDLLLNDYAPRMLITGVTDGVTFPDIIAAHAPQGRAGNIAAHCCIDLDYRADTTEGNAIESAQWIAEEEVQSIILVTSASHMPRALLQFQRHLPETVAIRYYPVRTQKRRDLFTSPDFWLYSAREYMEFLGSWIRLRHTQDDTP